MTYKFVEIEKSGHVATFWLNRPDRLNALSREVMMEIEDAARSFLGDEETRVVIFAGRGKHFCAGADLQERGNEPSKAPSLLMARRHSGLGGRMIRAITEMKQVTIAAIHGAGAGGGCCIPVACDFRIGSPDCKVGYPEVQRGMNLMWGALPQCVSLIGPARAKRMIMLGNLEPAQTLLEWGFLDEVVERDGLMDRAREIAEDYASRPPIAVQMIKESVNAVSGAFDQAAMHMDIDQNILTSRTDDFKEGIAAFLEKREPDFKGS
jgi:enoyl-CoA hydratase/carnithine racemase